MLSFVTGNAEQIRNL